mmetsp:Transcript_48195/g.59285  ORF Transcript_48195/g.59285 Transcript_48195/m.59285 type:complete len:187 (+) Transcript_48195:19-579(+)
MPLFYLRLDNEAPKWMSWTTNYDSKTHHLLDSQTFQPKKCKKITVYYQGKIEAHKIYGISVTSSMFDPVKCGTLDCTISAITFNVPDIFQNCKDDCTAKINVSEIKAPLAYESGGKKFDNFLDEISSVWRKHAMTHIKEGITSKKINQDVELSSKDMHLIIKALLKHCRSDQVVAEFATSFKSLKM